MSENAPPKTGPAAGANGADAAGIPAYEKQRQHVKELLAKKRAIQKRLGLIDESIFTKETEYLESTPQGNIITGFDNYTKGTTGAAAQRRRTGATDANRVFSRSSISFNADAPDAQTPGSVHSTPGSHAPTPLSTSFAGNKGGAGSEAATPTSATTAKGVGKKNKKSADDSETDTKEPKKVRTHFGAAGRK